MAKPLTKEQAWAKHGYRSGLEGAASRQLGAALFAFEFEQHVLPYEEPVKVRRYTPDFVLPNGIVVETKGRWTVADRQKMALVKKQHPDIDIRMVFQRSKSRIAKGSNTTYGMWCEKLGIPYADTKWNPNIIKRRNDPVIPQEWLEEPPEEGRIAAINALRKKT